MNRSRDLDTIAPDDPVVVSSPTKKSETTKPSVSVDKPQKPAKNIPNNSAKEFLDQKIYDILGHTKSPFSSFLVRPKVFSFTERDENEEIYLAVRPHWVTNIKWVIISILMLFVPLFFSYFDFLSFFPGQYRFSAVLFWYLFTFIYAFEKFLGWYFNVFLITDERVVDIDFKNMLNKHFAEADLSAIQDVSSSVKGLLGTFFNYGDVLIQTASEINQINFEKVPNPEKIIKLLKELRDLEEQEGGSNA
ncbi:MAG: PH domain-containing protein [Candidatus Shapirobacteria bacterium]|nr:PH domain-containing protein [Candidatus Shapirobacteria bacterium]